MDNHCVTVVIPARNEQDNITKVIEIIKLNKDVNQIIVVDNNSNDDTSLLAKKAGAEVVFCENEGKGYAMELGLQYVENDIVVFVDADISNYPENVVEALVKPILNNEADFVKSTFERTKGGTVTELVVKPMLDIFFPEMYKFSEPISGMIACKKKIMEELDLEKDYGVDIGILIDVTHKDYKIQEVNIGKIENMSHVNKTMERMRKMSTEIISAVKKRINKA